MAFAGAMNAAADPPELAIELNRLEQRGADCRVHLVLDNDAAQSYSSYRLDLVIFGADGVIARRLALEAAPLRAHKITVKEFEITDLSCAKVGSVLLNDVSTCASGGVDNPDCVAGVRLSSRGPVKFVK
jgi:hypothetical protein